MVASVILIAIGAALAWRFDAWSNFRRIWNIAPTAIGESGKEYLVQSSLPEVTTSTKDNIPELLLGAFQSGRLFEAGSWEIPGRTDAKLVFASPTASGKQESLACGFMGHPYCGLYVVTPTTTSLAAWGDALTGFSAIERFSDANHVIIGLAWSFWNYSNVVHKQINLTTGESVPLVSMELDITDTSAELQVSSRGRFLALKILGELDKSRLLPVSVTVNDEEDHTVYAMPANEVKRLSAAAAAGESRVQPILILPSERDLDSAKIHVQLYGISYELDMDAAKLTALSSF